jgi:hypothetical protein
MATEKEVTVKLDQAALRAFLGWQGEVGRRFERLAKESVFRMAGMAPKRFGGLAKSISYKKGRSSSGIYFDAGASVSYAAAQDQGGQPHIIRPRKPGGKLKFYWLKVGAVVYFSKVSHPGNPAVHYVERGFRRALHMWERGG